MNENSNKKEKVIRYLNKTYKELTDEQSLVEKQIMVHETKVKELYKAISIAEQEIDPNYNLFSPKKTGKIKMNDTLTQEVHLLENDLEELKYKNIRLIEKIDTTKDIIGCIIGESDNDLFEENSSFLDSLIYGNDNQNDNDILTESNSCDETSKEDKEDKEDTEKNNGEFEILSDVIEKQEEIFLDDVLRKKILNIQEIEKNRIAKDLYDSTVKNLTNLVNKSDLCLKLVDVDSIRTKLELQTIINTLKLSIDELNKIIYGLYPMSLDDFGLTVTIKKYIEQLNAADGPNFRYEIEGTEPKNMDSVVSLTLFRIIQEACNNAIKHASANNVEILVDFMDDCVNVIIDDDGKGFNHTYSFSDENLISEFGISIMRERTYLLSGKFKMDYSNENDKTGTKIIVVIPINNN